MRVLVTGAAGSLGRVVTAGLAEHDHDVVGLDLVPAPEGSTFAWHEADCTDGDAVAAVFAEERLDAVVHLAGIPEESSLPDALASHVVTTAALLDAMVAHRVPRIVYASSNHAVGRTPRADGELTEHALPRPDTYYGVAKVAAEALLRLFADRHGIRMVEAALTAPAPGFAVLHGISANTRAWWDLEPGRRLGYEPQDDAEAYADRIEPGPDDEAEAAHVGGPYALPAFHRPALGH